MDSCSYLCKNTLLATKVGYPPKSATESTSEFGVSLILQEEYRIEECTPPVGSKKHQTHQKCYTSSDTNLTKGESSQLHSDSEWDW